jgi:DNA-binding transcriptional LysR family regulator
VLFEREHALGQLVDRLCAAEGFTPRAAVRRAQIAGVAALASAGLGPALVPSNIVIGPVRNAVRSRAPPRARELCAFTRAAWSPLARALLDLVAEQPWPRREPEMSLCSDQAPMLRPAEPSCSHACATRSAIAVSASAPQARGS